MTCKLRVTSVHSSIKERDGAEAVVYRIALWCPSGPLRMIELNLDAEEAAKFQIGQEVSITLAT